MASLDVKTAFLNAELGEGARPVERPTEERLVLMLPPKILVRLGLVKEGELWAVDKALYGFRRIVKVLGFTPRFGHERNEGGVSFGSCARHYSEEG